MNKDNLILINDYASSFSTDNNLNYQYSASIMGMMPIRKSNDKGRKIIIFSELHIDNLDNSGIKSLVKNAPKYLEKYDADIISYYSFEAKDIPYFNVDYSFVKIKQAICELDRWELCSNVKRNIKKSSLHSIIIYNERENIERIIRALHLVKYADYLKGNSFEEEVLKHAHFYYRNIEDSIILIAEIENECVGCMMGIKVNNIGYMLEHYYNSKYNKLYINDLLYYNFIIKSKDMRLDMVNFGNIDVQDLGLERMKKKYSTVIKEKYILSYLRNN